VKAVETALYGWLSTDSSLTAALGGTAVFNTVVPPGTARPYVVFFNAGGGYANIWHDSPHQNLVYMVKAVADALSAAATIDELLEDRLHHAEGSLSVTGYTTLWLARENESQLVEAAANGDRIYHCGAYYRLRIE